MMQLIDTMILIKRIKTHRSQYKHDNSNRDVKVVPTHKRSELYKPSEEGFNKIEITNDVILDYCKIYGSLRKKDQLMTDTDLLLAASAKQATCC